MPDSEQERRDAMLAAILKIVPPDMHPNNKQAIVDEAAAAVRLYFEEPKIKTPSFKETKKLLISFSKKADALIISFNSMHTDQKLTLERIVFDGADGIDIWDLIENITSIAAVCSAPDKHIEVEGSKGGPKYDSRTRVLIAGLATIYEQATGREALQDISANYSHKGYKGNFLHFVFDCLVAAGEKTKLAAVNDDGESPLNALGEMAREMLLLRAKSKHES